MKGYLLDTSIVVFLFRGKYSIADKLRKIGSEKCFISEITIAELAYGAYHSDRVSENLNLLHSFVTAVNVIPFKDAIDEYARQKDLLVRSGNIVEDFDLFIGASAIAKDLIVVTDNVKHFTRMDGIEVENWVSR